MMTTFWHWFVILGTMLSLAGVLWLLFANRTTQSNEKTGHSWDGIEEYDNPLPMWWVWMFVGSVVFTLIYLAVYPGLGNFEGAIDWTSTDQHQSEVDRHDARFAELYASLASMSAAELAQSRPGMQVGRRIFINNCSTCHGVNGAGAPGFPNLADAQWIWGGSQADVERSILDGRNAQMPPWGPALGNAGVTNVANFVLALSGREHDAQKAAAGAPQYQTFCVSCHGPDGKGNALLGAPDLTNDIWLYGGDLVSIAETIRQGRNGMMPAHKDILGEQRSKIVATYVKTLGNER